VRAILVSVDFADLLAITLPYNRHHFEDVMVVTSVSDWDTVKIATQYDCQIYQTNVFYESGAVFNKWKALEEGLDVYGRQDWMCLMDADVLWPTKIDWPELKIGNLYTPRRRMMVDVTAELPLEERWVDYPLHPQQVEFAGYSQIFHSTDSHLGNPPWHEINWKHAGGADSFFQYKWPDYCKIRPGFEVLHLGAAGTNWCGRAIKYRDGSEHPDCAKRQQQVRNFVRSRTKGTHRFDAEKF
jgi:hypothetical protein